MSPAASLLLGPKRHQSEHAAQAAQAELRGAGLSIGALGLPPTIAPFAHAAHAASSALIPPAGAASALSPKAGGWWCGNPLLRVCVNQRGLALQSQLLEHPQGQLPEECAKTCGMDEQTEQVRKLILQYASEPRQMALWGLRGGLLPAAHRGEAMPELPERSLLSNLDRASLDYELALMYLALSAPYDSRAIHDVAPTAYEVVKNAQQVAAIVGIELDAKEAASELHDMIRTGRGWLAAPVLAEFALAIGPRYKRMKWPLDLLRYVLRARNSQWRRWLNAQATGNTRFRKRLLKMLANELESWVWHTKAEAEDDELGMEKMEGVPSDAAPPSMHLDVYSALLGPPETWLEPLEDVFGHVWAEPHAEYLSRDQTQLQRMNLFLPPPARLMKLRDIFGCAPLMVGVQNMPLYAARAAVRALEEEKKQAEPVAAVHARVRSIFDLVRNSHCDASKADKEDWAAWLGAHSSDAWESAIYRVVDDAHAEALYQLASAVKADRNALLAELHRARSRPPPPALPAPLPPSPRIHPLPLPAPSVPISDLPDIELTPEPSLYE